MGGFRDDWEHTPFEQEFATVSYEEMCDTIDKKIERHEEAARRQLRVRAAAKRLEADNLMKKNTGAHVVLESDRLKSNKPGTPGFCSMGGAGRSLGRHRTRNTGARDSGHFKLDHQKHMSQSFAADVTKSTGSEAPKSRNTHNGHRN